MSCLRLGVTLCFYNPPFSPSSQTRPLLSSAESLFRSASSLYFSLRLGAFLGWPQYERCPAVARCSGGAVNEHLPQVDRKLTVSRPQGSEDWLLSDEAGEAPLTFPSRLLAWELAVVDSVLDSGPLGM